MSASAKGGILVLRRLWTELFLAVLLLGLPAAAEAAIIIDPDYGRGGQALELSLVYYVPDEAFTLRGDWTIAENLSVSGHLEVAGGELVYGYLEGFNTFGPLGLSYGVIQGLFQGDDSLYYTAGVSAVFGRGTLGVMVSGDLFYGGEDALGAARAVALWIPAENVMFMAGVYAQGRYILATDLWDPQFEPQFEPHPYLHVNVRRGLGALELQVSGSAIFDLDYDLNLDYGLDLSLLYPLGDRCRIGGTVSIDGDPDEPGWTSSYGVEVAWTL